MMVRHISATRSAADRRVFTATAGRYGLAVDISLNPQQRFANLNGRSSGSLQGAARRRAGGTTVLGVALVTGSKSIGIDR